jgi:hypothetical protein
VLEFTVSSKKFHYSRTADDWMAGHMQNIYIYNEPRSAVSSAFLRRALWVRIGGGEEIGTIELSIVATT